MSDTPNNESLLQENRQLRARLEELEETLRAIRSGEVDALVVSGPEGEQIYTLKGAEEPYRVMVEEMTEGAVTFSMEGIILYCNQRFAELLKVPLEQVLGSHLRNFVPPAELSALETMLTQNCDPPVRCRITLQAADGTRMASLFSTRALKLDAVDAIAAVVTDLSEVIAADEARSRLALIVESSNDAIIGTTLDGVVESWNAAAERLFGYTAAEAVGRPVQSLVVPSEHAGEVARNLDTIGRGERTGAMETVRQRKDGTLIDVSVTVSPIKDAAGRIVGGSANLRDITERKQAEEKLRLSIELLRMIAETIQDVFWISSPGVKEMLYISPAYERLWGRSCESLYRNPLSFLDAVHPDDRTILMRIVKEKHAQGKAYEIEYRTVRPGGEMRWMHERGFPSFDADGHLKAMTGVVSDVTELKKTQAELEQHRQHLEELVQLRTMALRESEERYRRKASELEAANAKLQELDRLKSMFIASMSHELRTPLNSIMGFTGVILQGIAGPINEEQRKQLAIVKESGSHLLQLINDVIDVSKIEAGVAEVVVAEFDLAGLVREVADSFAVAVQKKGIELAVDAPENLPVASDQRRVRQILVNLLDNAVKFTDSGRIEFSLSADAEGVEIMVRDTGIGIDREDMAKLFGAFSQIVVDGRPREGTGLGLYLSQKMANLLGGRIAAQSKPGKGSVFILSLPANFRRGDE
ncbi:hypothetical protein FGKAn22_07820 [Ferrigenium kumadai]|uniref:histidine kinase n=1 Tax=Ferrigenium kumadai TaxID=1682490 RepID=A0AAN1T0F2_9PROT|nr:PAS domain S-box protein [Ferrigenium kumadai]BBI99089.1 hypothetical protein FGKAn22_07820 [Ferrigenium kumadai]